MQRDLKVGLSLGVLLLGVVGALLFRREQTTDAPKPTLRTARKIDERIAEGPRTPYMTGDVEFDQDEPSAGKERHAGPDENGRPTHTVPPNWLDDKDDPFQVARTPSSSAGPNGHSSTANGAIATQSRTGARNRPDAQQTHVIQSGESLSIIAEHYLGSQGRFQEIYEANQNVLTDPNRLPLGATIVIPPKNKVASHGHALAQGPASTQSLASHGEHLRGTITDVSALEPITPPHEATSLNREIEPVESVEQTAAPTPVVPSQVHETRKLFSPSRRPFANNRPLPANPVRKALDPEGEDFITSPASAANVGASGEARRYQVRKGDSLEKISLKIYGSARRAGDIFAANRSQLASPNSLREGQELQLPN